MVRTANAPYTTRVLVRRPADRARFSGTVIVEMLNPSNLFDLNIGWALSHKEFVRQGHAWVGITAKPVAIETLKTFNPARYATLSWANPLPLDDPRNCTTVARDTQRTTENGLVWDMHRQVAQWLRGRANNPLAYGAGSGAHPVQRLYAWGYSQTGGFLYTYVNAIHPLDVRAFGKPLFDAYFIAVASGPSPINQCAAPLAPEDARRRITDPGVPVVRVMSQSDYLRTMAARLPDGDTAPNQMRNYEIAGSGHATPDELTFAAKPEDIEKAGRAVPPMACNEGPRSRFPSGVAFNAILRNLDAWVRTGRGAAARGADPGGGRQAGPRPLRERRRGRAFAVRGRADEHVDGQLHGRVVLRDRGARAAVRRRADARALPESRQLRAGVRGERGGAGEGAVHHAGGREGPGRRGAALASAWGVRRAIRPPARAEAARPGARLGWPSARGRGPAGRPPRPGGKSTRCDRIPGLRFRGRRPTARPA